MRLDYVDEGPGRAGHEEGPLVGMSDKGPSVGDPLGLGTRPGSGGSPLDRYW